MAVARRVVPSVWHRQGLHILCCRGHNSSASLCPRTVLAGVCLYADCFLLMGVCTVHRTMEEVCIVVVGGG